MRKALSIAVFVGSLIGTWTSARSQPWGPIIELTAPRSPGRGDAIEVQITTGPLPRGSRLTLMTERGEILGAVYPFGQPEGRISTATISIDTSAMTGIHLRLRLQVAEPGRPPRPPLAGEVQRLELVLIPWNN
jgi:hypothetical protein